MNNTTILSVIIALVIGVGGGYFAGKSTAGTLGDSRELRDATSMMNNQSASIKQMGEMMKTGGMVMQDMGMKYKDDILLEKGKDMEVVGEKYMTENKSKSTEGAMNKMMAQ